MAQSLRFFSVTLCSPFWSLGHQAESLVTSFCFILVWLCLQPGPSSRRMEKEKKVMVPPSWGHSATIQRRFSSHRVLALVGSRCGPHDHDHRTAWELEYNKTLRRENRTKQNKKQDFCTFSEHYEFPSTFMREAWGLLWGLSFYGGPSAHFQV